MKRRLILLSLVLIGLVGGGSSSPAGALPASVPLTTTSDSYWGCAGTYHLDFGICVENPL